MTAVEYQTLKKIKGREFDRIKSHAVVERQRGSGLHIAIDVMFVPVRGRVGALVLDRNAL